MNIFLKIYFLCFFAAALLLNCSNRSKDDIKNLIPSFVKDSIYLSNDNSFSKEKAELGRYLFYDRRLSVNNTKACATCHAQQFSFTDTYNRSIGALGDLHQRNAKPLINIIFEKYLTAADSTLHFPEQQINNPMFSEHPVEMGWTGNENEILDRIRLDKFYRQQFINVFAGEIDPVTLKNIQRSLSTFIKTIFSFGTAYDEFVFKKNNFKMNSDARSGMQLFFSSKLHCGSCHGGINFNRPSVKNADQNTAYYFNTGLYNLDAKGTYPSYDKGLIELTHETTDMGKYCVPTLRNLAFTAPYFHDGSAPTLDEVIAIYENGGRKIEAGVYKGDGRTNPNKHPLITGFKLNSQERKELIQFLLSLSDSSITKNPAYANPFTFDETKKNNSQ